MIGFPRVFQTFFIHFHSRNNLISSRKMSLNKSRFQFQTCVKQFQHCVIIFRNYVIDIRHSNYLIRPTLSMRIKSWKQFRLISFIFTHLSSNSPVLQSARPRTVDSGEAKIRTASWENVDKQMPCKIRNNTWACFKWPKNVDKTTPHWNTQYNNDLHSLYIYLL